MPPARMHRLSSEKVARVAAGAILALALTATLYRMPGRLQEDWRRMTADTDWTARELAPATTWGVSGEALLRARQTIPRDATVAVVVGQVPPLEWYPTNAVPELVCDWLLPRRCVPVDEAEWVVAYHQPSELLAVHGQEIGLGPDVNVVRVAR
jgi:hypothetical protein